MQESKKLPNATLCKHCSARHDLQGCVVQLRAHCSNDDLSATLQPCGAATLALAARTPHVTVSLTAEPGNDPKVVGLHRVQVLDQVVLTHLRAEQVPFAGPAGLSQLIISYYLVIFYIFLFLLHILFFFFCASLELQCMLGEYNEWPV